MPAEVLLDCRARPHGAQRGIIIVVAIATGMAGCWLTRAIDGSPEPGWIAGLIIGSAIAALTGWFAMLGTRVEVDRAGQVRYSLHGRPNLVFDLRSSVAIRPVHEGLAQGVGIAFADPQASVRFQHKSGISPERMRRWREALGVDLVLEGFPAEMADELQRLRVSLPAAGPGAGTPGV